MGKIQIIFFNSGTLLNPKTKVISDKTIEALKTLRNHGVKLCATTRKANLDHLHLTEVEFDACIAFDGDSCVINDVPVFVKKHTEKSNKQIAVNAILDYYHLCKDEALAFGIGDTDIDLFSSVGYGIATKDATMRLKAVADEICGAADEDGVYRFLTKNLII